MNGGCGLKDIGSILDCLMIRNESEHYGGLKNRYDANDIIHQKHPHNLAWLWAFQDVGMSGCRVIFKNSSEIPKWKGINWLIFQNGIFRKTFKFTRHRDIPTSFLIFELVYGLFLYVFLRKMSASISVIFQNIILQNRFFPISHLVKVKNQLNNHS